MGDEVLYLEALNEVDEGKAVPALWAKVMVIAEGDKDKAKYQYVKLRVEQLAANKDEKKTRTDTSKHNALGAEYIPAKRFASIKSIPESKIVEMIREGFYEGRIKDGEWYVSRREIGKVGQGKESNEQRLGESELSSSTNTKSKKSNNGIVAGVVIFVSLIVVYNYAVDTHTLGACKSAIRDRLKYPASAKLTWKMNGYYEKSPMKWAEYEVTGSNGYRQRTQIYRCEVDPTTNKVVELTSR